MEIIKRSKNEKGITLVALIVTVLLIIIVSSIGVSTGIETINSVKLKKFDDELRIIHARVDVIYLEIQNGDRQEIFSEETPEKYIGGESYDSKQLVMDRTLDAVNITEGRGDFKYYTGKALEQYLEIEDIKQSVLINWKTREVISVEGIKIDNTRYYRYLDLYKSSYIEQESKELLFDVEQETNGDIIKVKITNVKIEGQEISNFTLKYKLDVEGTEWRYASSNYFETSVPGLYAIEIIDESINVGNQSVTLNPKIILNYNDTTQTYSVDLGFGFPYYETENINIIYRIKDSSGEWNILEGNTLTITDENNYEVKGIITNNTTNEIISSDPVYTDDIKNNL